MIVDLVKDASSKKKQNALYEVGILVNSAMHVMLISASKWEVVRDTLIFWSADDAKERAVFRVWHYLRRIEEDAFIRPISVTREFVKNQIAHVKKKPPKLE